LTCVNFYKNVNVLLGDANKNALMIFDKNLNLANQAKLKEGIIQVDEVLSGFLVTTMGSFSPTDNPQGEIYSLPK
jgi:hypothetical protein